MLLYLSFQMRQWKKKRASLTNHQVNNINRVRKFTIVVSVILAYYSVSCIVYVVTRCTNNIYRELHALESLGIALGGSSDLCINYVSGTEFRKEFWKMMDYYLGKHFHWVAGKNIAHNLPAQAVTAKQHNLISERF